jgi:protoheme IX farnesyltransferase
MLIYTLLLWPVSVVPSLLGIASAVYGMGALGLSALFTACAVRVCCDQSDRAARAMFGFSLLYLLLIFSLLLVDHAAAGLARGGWR